jgi:hypothetical protein
MSATPYVLGAFALVVGPLLFRAWLRRGHNLLERLPLNAGETVEGEHDIELSEMPRRRAVITTLAFMRGRARMTSQRVVLAQPGLSATPTLVTLAQLRQLIPHAVFGYGAAEAARAQQRMVNYLQAPNEQVSPPQSVGLSHGSPASHVH